MLHRRDEATTAREAEGSQDAMIHSFSWEIEDLGRLNVLELYFSDEDLDDT